MWIKPVVTLSAIIFGSVALLGNDIGIAWRLGLGLGLGVTAFFLFSLRFTPRI